jgi:hypothetical protein
MKTFNNRPIFLANVDADDCTITTISLVDDPAMQLPMYCFEKEMASFSMQDEMQHNIISCIVRTDYPILRLTPDGNPYYIVFNKETSKKLCQKLMKDGFQQCISLDHNGKLIEGIQLQEVFIKDSEKGISPKGFEDAAEGSLFGIYHITDEQLWQDCLDGKFGGVSMETWFDIQNFHKINKGKISMTNKIKEMLKRMLMEFNNLSTNIADLYWEEDTELMVGYKVFVEDEAGNKVPAADGEYVSDENVIKVEGGVVTEIEKKEDAPEETQEEVKEDAQEAKEEAMEAVQEEVQETVEETQETPAETKEEEEEDKTAELEKRVSDLEAKIAELETKLVEIATAPAAEPVVDEFEKVTKKSTTGDKKLDKRIAIAQALKN